MNERARRRWTACQRPVGRSKVTGGVNEQQLRDDYDDRMAHGHHDDNDENYRRTRGGGGTPARPVQRSVFECANAVPALHDMADDVSQCRQHRNIRERRDKRNNIIIYVFKML